MNQTTHESFGITYTVLRITQVVIRRTVLHITSAKIYSHVSKQMPDFQTGGQDWAGQFSTLPAPPSWRAGTFNSCRPWAAAHAV